MLVVHRFDLELTFARVLAGDVVIFDRYTLHRSGQNWTTTPRYAYACQFQSDHARLASTGMRDPRRMRAQDLSDMMRVKSKY